MKSDACDCPSLILEEWDDELHCVHCGKVIKQCPACGDPLCDGWCCGDPL